jgi:hypothetical protein
MNLGRSPETDLPIYGPETRVLFGAEEIRNAIPTMEEDSFVRAVMLEVPKLMGNNLVDVLTRTDIHLSHIARLCGATVIEHTWGLFDAGDEEHEDVEFYRGNRPATLGLKEKQMLVAKVPIINNVVQLEPDSQDKQQIDKGLKHESFIPRIFKMEDFKQSTFVRGSLRSRPEELFLVDIDLFWYQPVFNKDKYNTIVHKLRTREMDMRKWR